MENPLLSPVAETMDLESSAIWTVRYIDPSGYECQLSLEARTGVEALTKSQLAIEKLKENQCVPLSQKSSNSQVKVPESKDEAPRCSIHDVPMRRWEKNGKVWYAHKENDHWCRGK